MAADSTLVNASFKEVTSRIGTNVPNLNPLYESNKLASGKSLEIITGAMNEFKIEEERRKVGKENQLKSFKSIVNNAYKSLYLQKETMPQKVVNALEQTIKELQEEFEVVNTWGEGDTVENERARIRINAQLQKVVNQAINARATFLKIGQSIDNWNGDAIKESIIAPQSMMMDLDNMDKNDNVTVGFDDNFKLTFTAKNYNSRRILNPDSTSTVKFMTEIYGDPVSFNLEQMEKNVPMVIADVDNGVIEQINTANSTGAKVGSDPNGTYNFDLEKEKGDFLHIIDNEEDFQSIATRRVKGLNSYSFRDSLIEYIDIDFDILNSMFYDDNGVAVNFGEAFKSLDLDGDEKLDKDDENKAKKLSGKELEIYKSNKRLLLDALTHIDHPAFNFERSKSLLGDYYTGLKKQSYDNAFKNSRARLPLKEGEAWEGSYKYLPTNFGNRTVEYNTGKAMLDSMRKADKGEATWFGLYNSIYEYNPKTKTWKDNDDADFLKNYPNGLSTTKLIDILGITAPEFKALRKDLPDLVNDPNTGVEEIDDEVVKSMSFSLLGGAKEIKKINGVWHKKGSETIGWVKVSDSELKRINKKYK
jgi:hypothetical protein